MTARTNWLWLWLLLLAVVASVLLPIVLGLAAGFAHAVISEKPRAPILFKDVTQYVTRAPASSAAAPEESLVCE